MGRGTSETSHGRLAVGAALAAAVAVALPARPDDRRHEPPTIGASVEVLQIDVAVVDASGRPVPDLRASDFELRAEGRVQPISNFAYVRAAPPAGAGSASILASRPASAGGGEAPSAVPGDGTTLEPAALLVVVDTWGLGPGSVPYVRDALALWASRLAPADRVGVVHAGLGRDEPLEALLADRALLRRAIASIRYSLDERGSAERPDAALAPGLGIEENWDGAAEQQRGMRATDVLRQRHFVAGTYATLAWAVRRVRALAGRKHVLLITHALPGLPAAIIEAANRSRVVVHTLDPRGPVVTFPVHDPNVPSTHEGFAAAIQTRTSAVARERQVLAQLAEATGGLALRGTNDLVAALERVASDRRGYYLLGYLPEVSGPGARRPEGRRIEVRVKARGLEVRTRSTAYARSIGAP